MISEVEKGIKLLIESNNSINKLKYNNDGRIINEVCDLYGFSLIKHPNNNKYDLKTQNNSIMQFKNDDNWYNTKSIDLMCQSYNIIPISIIDYQSSWLQEQDSIQILLNNKSDNYLHIKSKQHKLFASKLYQDGIKLKDSLQYNESIIRFTDAIHYDDTYIDAYQERAMIYKLLGKTDEAILDYEKILRLTSKSITTKDNISIQTTKPITSNVIHNVKSSSSRLNTMLILDSDNDDVDINESQSDNYNINNKRSINSIDNDDKLDTTNNQYKHSSKKQKKDKKHKHSSKKHKKS